MTDKYWLLEDSRFAINKLCEYREQWASYNNSPIRQAWIRNYMAYYSPAIAPSSNDSSMIFEGTKGELVRIYTPKMRSIIQRQVNIVCKQRIAAQGIADASGSDVIEDLKLSNALLDDIIEKQQLDSKYRELVEGSLVCGAWFTETNWRTDRGEPYTRDHNDSIIYTGGTEINLLSVFDVYYDMTLSHWDQLSYAETRMPMNRWDLIAQHTDLKEEILKLPSTFESRRSASWFDRTRGEDEDLVYVYKMYAKPSPALPVGRMIIYGDENTVFYDDENPYKCIPVEPMMPEKTLGGLFGYPSLTNIMPAQEMMDNSLSAIATNQSQFAVQNIAIPRNGGISVQEVSSSMTFISYTPQNVPGGGLPTALNLTQSSPDTYKFIDLLDKKIEDISPGINETLSGRPPAGVTSGTAIATLSANGIESASGITSAGINCLKRTLMHAVNCYKLFAKLEQKVAYKGRNQKSVMKKFKGENLKCISGIKIEIVNPLLQTVAGRLEIAEKLLTMPKEIWPMYCSVLEGEPLRDIYKGQLSQNDLIHSENEMLFAGENVFALATDDHGAHVQQHAELLNDPSVRLRGASIKVILDHIEEHKNLAQNTDPFMTAMVRTGKVPDMPPEMQGPPGMPGMPGIGAPASVGPAMPENKPEPRSNISSLAAPKTGGIEGDIAKPARDNLGRDQNMNGVA